MPKFGEQPGKPEGEPIVPENPDDLQKRMDQKIAGERGRGFVEIRESTTPEKAAEQPESPKEVNIENIVKAIGDAEIPGVSYAENSLRSIFMDNGINEEDADKIKIDYDGDRYGGSISIDGIKVFDYVIHDPEDPDWSFTITECDKESLRSVLEKYGKK